MNYLFTCGGTAGHINPAVAVAGKIKELDPDANFLFVGAKGHMEENLVPREGYDIRTVLITNISRGFSFKAIKHNINTVLNVFRSTREAKKIIKEFKPDIAIGTGGYVCYPVLKAANKMGIPTVVHESNAVPGLTTKMLSKKVDKILLGFEDSRQYYKNKERTIITGTPVRGAFSEFSKNEAKEKLGLNINKPLVVSVWGSLGSDHMNKIMTDFTVKANGESVYKIIHSAGKRGYDKMMNNIKTSVNAFNNESIEIREYIYDMPIVMAAADLIMCRAGASTLAELTYMGKPAILVPSPNVTNNHQEKNSRILENAGGAKVLLEGQFDSDSLSAEIDSLINDKDTLNKMAESMKKLAVMDSTDKIADIIINMVKK